MDKMDVIISASDKVQKDKSVSDPNIPRYLFNNKKIDNQNSPEKQILEIEEEKIAEILNNFVGDQFDNFTLLIGAGASILNSEGEDLTGYSGKTISELTKIIASDLKCESINENLFSLDELVEKVNYFSDNDEINIEDLLSKAEAAREFIDENEKFNDTLKAIEEKIQDLCTLTLHKLHPHSRFLNKISARRKSHNRVKIFTTNYDTLIEQVAQKEGFILVDGFTYNFPRKFNPFMYDYDFVRRGDNKIIDEPDYVEKVIHLYKLHGSIDWKKEKEDKIVKQENTQNPLMIFPRRNKFEQSYEPPYFEIFSRFQIELRKKNTLFISIGFSFADKHIRTIVENAMINNPSLKILIVDYDLNQDTLDIFKERVGQSYQNVMLFQGDFSWFERLYLKQKAYSDQFFEIGEKNE